MADEWKRTEVLLEEIRSDVKAIAEGHSVLSRKIDDNTEDLREDLGGKIDNLTLTVKEISRDLKEHIRQTVPPAHVPV